MNRDDIMLTFITIAMLFCFVMAMRGCFQVVDYQEEENEVNGNDVCGSKEQ